MSLHNINHKFLLTTRCQAFLNNYTLKKYKGLITLNVMISTFFVGFFVNEIQTEIYENCVKSNPFTIEIRPQRGIS